jgi:putative transposase
MNAVQELASITGVARACQALAVPRAAFYRWRNSSPPAPRGSRRQPVRALSEDERDGVLEVLHAPRFVDKAPAEVYARLLDEGTYLCSVRTMYRLLDEHQEVRERRDQLRHPAYHKPELLACGPNQVWSWDITKLLGPAKWTYFYLYVILDIFSRFVVGWLLAHRESAGLAGRLIQETLVHEGVDAYALTIHSDRGPAMKSQTVAQLLATLGITKSHSRPHCSNDNPFSESQFKTLKYQPQFPDRFDSYEEALAFCRRFFPWYNHEHYHWGLGLLTPATVHYGQAETVRAQRQRILDAAHASHPERFPKGRPSPLPVPKEVWINPPQTDTDRLLPGADRVGALIETNPAFGSTELKSDLLGSRITHDLEPARLLTPPNFAAALANGTRYRAGNRGEEPVLLQQPDAL